MPPPPFLASMCSQETLANLLPCLLWPPLPPAPFSLCLGRLCLNPSQSPCWSNQVSQCTETRCLSPGHQGPAEHMTQWTGRPGPGAYLVLVLLQRPPTSRKKEVPIEWILLGELGSVHARASLITPYLFFFSLNRQLLASWQKRGKAMGVSKGAFKVSPHVSRGTSDPEFSPLQSGQRVRAEGEGPPRLDPISLISVGISPV